MADTVFCLDCGKKINRNAKHCKYCGEQNPYCPNGTIVESADVFFDNTNWQPPKPKKERKGFTVEEQFFFGLCPDDEMYRKGLEIEIMTKNYKEQD